jgi:SNF2 family DNA or RNA helicase
MPGLQWIPAAKVWRGPREAVGIAARTLEAAEVVKIADDLPFQHPDLDERLSYIDTTWPDALRDYQHKGAAWITHMLRSSGAALLADEMGIGKSAQAIAALDSIGCGFSLVICPAIVRPHWKSQLKQWGSRADHAWTILSYEGFGTAFKNDALPSGIDSVIIDEIHYASNPKAQRSKAIADWLKANPSIKRIGLSGTPMTATPAKLWHPLQILWPGRFGRKFDFERRYCDGHWVKIKNLDRPVWDARGVSRSEELAERLRAVMLRRTKAEVALELPARTRQVIDVDLPRDARRTLLAANAAIDWSGAVRGTVTELLSRVEEHKLDAAVALANEVMANGHRPLLLTTRRAAAEEISRRLCCPNGSEVDAAHRRELVVSAPCATATIYALTTGIDLTGFDTIIFVGLDWIPSTLLQAEARVHRIGQDRPVTIYYLIGTGTLDEVVRERVLARLDQFGSIVGAGDEGEMRTDLSGGSEDDILAAVVAAVRHDACAELELERC